MKRSEVLSIVGYGDDTGTGVAEVVVYDGPARVKRALAGLALSWGAALAGLFIPVAHFLLVPGFLIFGIIVFVSRMRVRVRAESVHGTCPDCGAEQDFEAAGAWSLPRRLDCTHCGRSLTARAS
jgi:predicted RNA-binding Zn-ribbon protein involved in translation (DUF1610 family)